MSCATAAAPLSCKLMHGVAGFCRAPDGCMWHCVSPDAQLRHVAPATGFASEWLCPAGKPELFALTSDSLLEVSVFRMQHSSWLVGDQLVAGAQPNIPHGFAAPACL
jgi:hypothetical protein